MTPRFLFMWKLISNLREKELERLVIGSIKDIAAPLQAFIRLIHSAGHGV